MIADWRRQFGLPDLSFFYVQLAPYSQDYSRIRLAQGAALQLPKVGFAVALDLGDLTSPSGSIHPRRKQEVGRRLALSARAIQYDDRSVVYQGPTLSAVQFVSSNTSSGISYGARLSFMPGTADGLHAAGTADCVACCEELPFEVMDATGLWTRAAAVGITGDEVLLRFVPHPILGIRFDFGGMPQCALYNGVGGPDDHQGLAAPPFQYCAYGTHDGQPAWAASCEPNDPSVVAYPATTLKSSSTADFVLSGGASMSGGPADARCSGNNIRSGNPGGVGVIMSRYGLDFKGHTLDSVGLGFRYAAGYTPPAGQTKIASNLTVQLRDSAGAVLKTLFQSPPLGNYSYDAFAGYSPIVGGEWYAGLRSEGKVFITLVVFNNERNVQLALDDLEGGFNVSLRWA